MKNFLRKMIKNVELSNTDKFIILFSVFILIILFFITLHISELKWETIPEIIRNLFLLFTGVLGIQILNLVFNKKGQHTDTLCEYQKYLRVLGIIQVYNKRKGTIEKGYLKDLLDEFNNLNKEHISSDKPIKMIGVSLDAFFEDATDTDDLPSAIATLCSSAYFRIMLCSLKNKELELRLKFVNSKCNTDINIDATPIITEISASIRNIKALCNKDSNYGHLESYQYEFSPYATIIIINDNIYYTPNMLDYLSYLPNEYSNRYKFKYDTELSLCIRRYSEYGKRLEELFDSLWANEIKNVGTSTKNSTDKKVGDE